MKPRDQITLAFLRNWIAPLALLSGLIVIWQVAVVVTAAPQWLVPAPTDVATALVEDRKILLENALVTLQEVLIGFILAIMAGVGCGIAITRFPILDRALYPLIIASQTVPIPA